ncbi:non-hydrolyzing UDP-N-acetylglucosamine 2-epimerase [Pseudalkalibacillus berkeleyi]|uniref:UDP-N-acetylglucosamine 2-epimerase (Non-hydrolyzing) n=1 Tax=Pseudalkalibacillus berkeleyi TaxID=1069813 RepID=A0ABS9GZ10_9BACL|nr:UDP-N-acetylglucosamine 2-epimerase (non-hydrolyzing) [Pseudalkalibacillus berkeleyi]MCF6136889.1 UDP-N-acetylglucosamine 2-epimerase (non-hydrolyzing) [Pseudalkalibacillus berkeleyi]
MKIVTILGTRPEIIRLSLILNKLDQWADQHVIVHTGQNFVYNLSEIFFKELEIRMPDYILQTEQRTLGQQLGTMFEKVEEILIKEKPDKVLVLGDTNSALSAILSERMGIPVIHMEAGNRCFDLSVPEEKNRKVIDAISTYNLPYTPNSKENLIREGVPSNRILLFGNPIYEVLAHFQDKIDNSHILSKLQLTSGEYFLVTAHRAENVDNPKHLNEIFEGLNSIAQKFNKPIICSIHPRTKSRLEKQISITHHPLVRFFEPFGFFDFVKLEKNAFCVLTDSGTVQEECCIFQVPTVTIRNSTERPETVDCGSNVISGLNRKQILDATTVMVNSVNNWECPAGYIEKEVSQKVVQFILGGR